MMLLKPLALLVLSSATFVGGPVIAQQATPPPVATVEDAAPSAMNAETFYDVLMGELAIRNEDPAAAFPYFLNAARKTNDAKLFQRSVEAALLARSGESALAAARAWRQALPTSREANRYVLQILVGLNRLAEAMEPLKREVAAFDVKERPLAIANLPRYFTRAADKKLAATVVEQALADQMAQPITGVASWTTIGRMRIDAGDLNGGLDAARRVQTLDPQAEGAALLGLMLMGPKVPAAEGMVQKYLSGPNAQGVIRLDYARILIGAQRYAEATIQLQTLTTTQPDVAQAWLILGTLELQEKKYPSAEKTLKHYVELVAGAKANSPKLEDNQGLVQAYLALAQIAEQSGDLTQAQAWLGRIDNADDMFSAQVRRAAILARQGKLEEGRALIRNLPEKGTITARQKISAEVQLLRENKQNKAAYDLLAESTAKTPQDVDLMYDQAMLAEKLGKLDEMEILLRRVMDLKPDFHHAYNALGYSFAERNVRLPEARELIKKSLEYAPGDPFITDSLGWVEFRSGNLNEALRILQGAYTEKPDAEIAAHLGEVLWTMGKRDQALAVWKEGIQLNAENETLTGTLKRLRVKL